MLNRIIIINSDIYAKASIYISDIGSIQLAAENNVGKSSFVNALNFLFIIDKEDMVFEDGRLLPASMKHYFNGTISHSYIIFEIKRGGCFCIIVKATAENNIEYYKIEGAYNEDYFIKKQGEKFEPKHFEKEVLRDIRSDKPKDTPLRLKTEELYSLVYNTDERTSPVVWIKKNVKRKTNSYRNSFTDIYRHLLKTSAIDEKSFKKALLVAANQHEEELNVFSERNQSEILDFEKKKKNLSNLYLIKDEFEQLKLNYQKLVVTENLLGKLKHTFISLFQPMEKQLSADTADDGIKSINIRTLQTKINDTLKKERDSLRDSRTIISSNKATLDNAIIDLQNEISELSSYEPNNNNLLYKGLKDGIDRDNEKLTNLQADVTLQQRYNFSEHEVAKEIEAIKKDIKETQADITDFKDLVVQNIAADKETRLKVASYLSEAVLRLNKRFINSYVENISFLLKIFEGEIDVSGVPIQPLKTKEDLQLLIEKWEKELGVKKQQLATIKNLATRKAEIEKLSKDIKTKEVLIKRIENKPLKQKELSESLTKSESYQAEINRNTNSIESIELKIENEGIVLSNAKQELEDLKGELKKIREWNKTIYFYTGITAISEIIDGEISDIFQKFEEDMRIYSDVKSICQELFFRLSKPVNYDGTDVKKFIDDVSEEFNNISASERALTVLSETLANKFSLPTSQFLEKLHKFKASIHKFNAQLAKYPISNIREIKIELKENGDLVKDFRSIANLRPQRFDFEQNVDSGINNEIENQNTLDRYFANSKGKVFTLDELFSLSIEIVKNNGDKDVVRLSGHGQGQSKGTNVVLKLILYMSILKDFVHSNADNKVVLYIDELEAIGPKNIKTLTRFCREHFFVPLFAAPRKVEGVEKYYVIKEPVRKSEDDRGKIIFDERSVVTVKYDYAE